MPKKLIISPNGDTRFVYDDNLRGLMEMGDAKISRASHVEPDPDNPTEWMVDLSPVGGPTQKGFKLREEALRWEVEWLNDHRLGLPEPGQAGLEEEAQRPKFGRLKNVAQDDDGTLRGTFVDDGSGKEEPVALKPIR